MSPQQDGLQSELHHAQPGDAPRSQAGQLAELATALQTRIASLHTAFHPSWDASQRLAALPGLRAGEPRQRVALALFQRYCGTLPPLRRLAEGAGSWALLERQPLLARLCALALLGRPGVLRSCVERPARDALQQMLGDRFALLRLRCITGMPVRSDVAAWPPLAWAWVGYRELARAGAWPHPSLARLARFALPPGRRGAPPPPLVPPAASPPLQRLAELDRLFAASAGSASPW